MIKFNIYKLNCQAKVVFTQMADQFVLHFSPKRLSDRRFTPSPKWRINLRFTLLLLALLAGAGPALAQTTRSLYTDSTGTNIGIGTTTPQASFVVTNGNMGIGTWTAGGGRLIVSGGNVGIGTSLPSQALTISGNLGFTNGPRVNDSSGKLQFQAGGTGTGSTGTGSIYFLDSSAVVKGRVGTTATDSVAATGGTITTSGGNTIHTFTSSGTFTVNTSGTVSYLVVAGGGGGGGASAPGGGRGGGGAGGMSTGTLAVTAQAYTVTVGAGGAGGGAETAGSNGSDSVFGSITSTGGGGGGGAGNINATNGGSGGGSANAGSLKGTGIAGQGNDGGQTVTGTGGSGGGGAGAVGSSAGAGLSGAAGGAGSASSISGSSVTYAGGGGGGAQNTGTPAAGGSGGGGAGAVGANATNGTANTGGGGGGSGGNNTTGGNGGTGGSGIVIISYTTGSVGYGTIFIGATNTSSADLAEYYVASDPSMEAGDVVCLSNIKIKDNHGKDISNQGVLSKCSTPNDPHLIGIISTNPGVILGSIDSDTGNKDKRLLALSHRGRVPTKVSIENGPIAVGDHLTSSSSPGVAMKQTQSGQSIGIALQDSSAKTDKISVFVDLGYQNGD